MEQQETLFNKNDGKGKTENIQIRLPCSVVDLLDKQVELTGEKRSVIILQALKAYLQE